MHELSRRAGLISLISTIASLMAKRASAEPLDFSLTMQKPELIFALDTFAKYSFTLGDEIVELRPEELMNLLRTTKEL